MRNSFQKITLWVFASITLVSCSKSGDVSPISITGKWNLTTITSNVEYKNDTPDNTSEDVSSQGLYFDFASDGTYTTNGAIELGNVNENGGSVSSGTYKISNSVLNLSYSDPDLGPVTLYLNTAISGNNMTLSLGKADLVKAFADATGVDPFTQAFIQIFLDEIVKFDYSMKLVKA